MWPAPIHAQTLASPAAGVWWSGSRAPARYDRASAQLSRAVRWSTAAAGVESAALDVTVNGGPLRVHVILVRLHPSDFTAHLVQATDASRVRGSWIVDSAAADAVVAVNAGQFEEAGPWGWIVRDGRELAPPGAGPLAAAIGFTRAGNVRWIDGNGQAAERAALGAGGAGDRIETAFQSYPRLLTAGSIPSAIRTGTGVDSRHRDARVAIGQMHDGRIILALTRFGARESVVSRIPVGLTLAETAALMGSLGCSNAMMLDGGLSAQMMIRPAGAEPIFWRGARRVPVGLVFKRRLAR